jgi:ribosomal protein S27E
VPVYNQSYFIPVHATCSRRPYSNFPESEINMAISVSCDCGRSYQVTAKHAGKRFRCKSCGEKVTVPSRSGRGRAKSRPAQDDFEDFGEDEFEDYVDDSYASEDDYSYPPASRPQRGSSKRRSKRRRKGMPISVIVALGCEGILIAFNLLSMVGNLATLNCGAVLLCALPLKSLSSSASSKSRVSRVGPRLYFPELPWFYLPAC